MMLQYLGLNRHYLLSSMMKDETRDFFLKDLKENNIQKEFADSQFRGELPSKMVSICYTIFVVFLVKTNEFFRHFSYFRQMPDDVTLDRFLIMSSQMPLRHNIMQQKKGFADEYITPNRFYRIYTQKKIKGFPARGKVVFILFCTVLSNESFAPLRKQ